MEIAEFLLARIAEDESVAREWPADRLPPPNGDALWIDALGHPIYQPRARVLAECEAKRQIVEKAARLESIEAGPVWDAQRWSFHWAMRALALPYAEHADYDPEWKV